MPSTTFEDEPTFTYTKEEVRAATADMASTATQHAVVREDAAHSQPVRLLDGAPPIRNREDLQRALASEARAHQWEHKQPAAETRAAFLRLASVQARTFTREEIDDILRLTDAQTSWIDNADRRAGAVDVICALRKFFREKE